MMPITCKLTQISYREIRARPHALGIPTHFAVAYDGTVVLWPQPAVGEIKSMHVVMQGEPAEEAIHAMLMDAEGRN